MYNSNNCWSSFKFKMSRKSSSFVFLEILFSHFDQISGGCSRPDIEESGSTWVDFFTFTVLLELPEKVKTFTFYFSSSQFRQSLGILCIGQMTSLAEAVSRTSY